MSTCIPSLRFSTVLVLRFLLGAGLCLASISGNLSLAAAALSLPAAKVLVLDDCDDDFRTPPFEDAVAIFGAAGKLRSKVANLNLCQTVGGSRALAASKDGRFFLVCENVANKLSAYETETAKRLWSLPGEFGAVTIAENGAIYAVINSGRIEGNKTVVMDAAGRIAREASVGGIELAVDSIRQAVWVVGADIKKCDLDLNVLVQLDPLPWCAVSADIGPDGSLWVAERRHSNVAGSQNRILKISPAGEIQHAVPVPWVPYCLRVNRSDGSVWVTGAGFEEPMTGQMLKAIEKRTGPLELRKGLREFLTETERLPKTRKYNPEGKLLLEISQGGHSLDLDPADGSVWIASHDQIWHYSAKGRRLVRFGGVSSGQKYVVVVPEPAGQKSCQDAPR